MKELNEALKHVRDFHDVSTTLDVVIQDLFILNLVISPLNAIYEIMQENYYMTPFTGGLISTDTINQFKAKLDILKVKAMEMDQNSLSNNHEDSNELQELNNDLSFDDIEDYVVSNDME